MAPVLDLRQAGPPRALRSSWCGVSAQRALLRHLAKRWPLEFRPDFEPAVSP